MASGNDNRRFKRYSHVSECFITFEETSFRGNSTDYSLEGIGFSLDGTPALAAGTPVRIRIETLDLEDNGIITWSRTSGSSLKAGVRRKSISGRLKNFPVADILIDLQRSLKTGILILSSGPVKKKIYIREGDIVYATSGAPEDRLIDTVLRAGRITREQYRQVSDVSQEQGKTHAAVLVELGYLKAEDIVWAVKKQVEDIILSIFPWQNSRFAFLEGPRVSDKVITLKLSTANIIYRGIKGIRDATVVANALPPMNTVLQYSSAPLDMFQDLSIDAEDNDVISLVNGKRSLQEILSMSPLDHFRTMLTLYALLCTRIIDSSIQKSGREDMHEDHGKEPSPQIDPAFVDEVESLYNRLGSIDHYSFLGIEKRATSDVVRKAYHVTAKKYHPDKHLHLSSTDLKNKLNAIFSHLTDVYRTLSNPKTRASYDEKVSASPPVQQQSTAELAQARCKEGEEALKRGDFAEARELFGQAVYLDGSVAAYHYHLARALQQEHKFREAGKMLNQALALDPFNADYLAELGHVYLKLGFPLRAKSVFEKAIKSDPHNARAITGLHMLQSYSAG
jgi:tetratricopeptide (TPR) repeat protein